MSEAADEWAEAPSIEAQTMSYLMRGLTTLWELTKTEHTRIWLAVGIMFVTQCINVFIPLLFTEMTDYIPTIVADGLTNMVLFTIVTFLGVILLLELGSLVLHHYVQEPIFLTSLINLENYWPCLAQKKLLALSVNFHERENTGKKIAKVNKGVEKMVGIVGDLFWTLCPQLFFLIVNVAAVLYLDWRLGLLLCLPFIPVIWIQLKSYRKFYSTWELWERKKEESVGLLCQSVINVRTVQRFVNELRERSRHDSIRHMMRDLDMQSAVGMQNYFFAMSVILRGSFGVTIAVGLLFVVLGWNTMGTVIYVFLVGKVILENMWGMVQVYTRLLRHIVAAERMYKLLEEPVDVANERKGQIPEIQKGVLEFNNTALVYPGKSTPVIEDFNLTIEPGKMLALVGRSGSGKSTLVNILARVCDVTLGSVTIDGHDIRTVDRDWYRKRFAFVPQDVEVFDGSILQNIAYAQPDAPRERIELAVKTASLHETLSDPTRFPMGLNTEIGERGVKLSGGERQRVGIARACVALLSGAPVLILDEATGSLDSEAERDTQIWLESLRRQLHFTIVAIAHRLSTIRKADLICVLDKGKIVEMGDHNKLLNKNGLYNRLVQLQELGELRE